MSGFNVKANSSIGSFLYEIAVCFRTPISKELPHIAHFLDFVEIQIRHDHFLFVSRSLRNDLAAWSTKIALPVKFADVPRLLAPDAIDRPDEIAISDGMGGLLELP